MTRFGDFSPLCSNTPSYPWCNLFYRQVRSPSQAHFPHPIQLSHVLFIRLVQLEHHSSSTLTGVSADANSAPVGINPTCGILRAGHQDSLGNIANVVACGISILVVLGLIIMTGRRKAAVGKSSPLELIGSQFPAEV